MSSTRKPLASGRPRADGSGGRDPSTDEARRIRSHGAKLGKYDGSLLAARAENALFDAARAAALDPSNDDLVDELLRAAIVFNETDSTTRPQAAVVKARIAKLKKYSGEAAE